MIVPPGITQPTYVTVKKFTDYVSFWVSRLVAPARHGSIYLQLACSLFLFRRLRPL